MLGNLFQRHAASLARRMFLFNRDDLFLTWAIWLPVAPQKGKGGEIDISRCCMLYSPEEPRSTALPKDPAKWQKEQREIFFGQKEPMQQRVTPFNIDQNVWTPKSLLEVWHRHLQEKDRSAGTVKKYTQ